MSTTKPCVEIIEAEMVEALRQIPPSRKLSQMFGMWDFALTVMKASIRAEHPDWTAEQIQREILRRMAREYPDE